MPAFANTPFGAWETHPDPRSQVDIPIMSIVQQRQFVKMALSDVPGGPEAFQKHFGGSYIRNGRGPLPIPDVGVPWSLGYGVDSFQ
jgi:hypothetical protein